jgi:hypothetical protein
MKHNHFLFQQFPRIALLFISAPWMIGQTTPTSAGVPVSLVVTAQGHHGAELPSIGPENVTVSEGHTHAKVTDWVPLKGKRGGLELYLLLDASVSTSQGTQLEDIHRFIMTRPATTKIGVAYMQDGGTRIAQGLTADHALAGDALHVTLGRLAKTASPYVALEDLIKQWPAGDDRREILMISNGSDPFYGGGESQDNIYLDAAVEQAQRAGIVVFTIDTSHNNFGAERTHSDEIGSGLVSGDEHGSSRIARGRNYLAQVAAETGGESYYQESGPISIAPYLEDASRRLDRQYLLTFLAKPGKKAGMQTVKVRTEVAHAGLVSAEKVYVPIATQ